MENYTLEKMGTSQKKKEKCKKFLRKLALVVRDMIDEGVISKKTGVEGIAPEMGSAMRKLGCKKYIGRTRTEWKEAVEGLEFKGVV